MKSAESTDTGFKKESTLSVLGFTEQRVENPNNTNLHFIVTAWFLFLVILNSGLLSYQTFSSIKPSTPSKMPQKESESAQLAIATAELPISVN